MQVKFAYAASSMTRGGEASIGDAARAAAAPASETAAIATLESIQGWAVEPAPFDQEKKNKVQTASRSDRRARPPRRRSTSLSRVRPPALPPTRIGRAWPSARGYGGTFSASVLPAAQAMLEIGATILAGGVHARKVTSQARGAQRRRAGPQACSMPVCRRWDADFAQHGEACFAGERLGCDHHMPLRLDQRFRGEAAGDLRLFEGVQRRRPERDEKRERDEG